MNWGNKLVLVFIAFAGLMGTLVYKCMHQNFELVSKDYYSDELRYQDKIDGMNNANKISDVQVRSADEKIAIQLPKELNGLKVEGQAWFYCPTNSLNDRKIEIQVDDAGLFEVDKKKLAKANYLVKLSWKVGNDQYNTETPLAVN